jgi:hypothetical protein
MPIFIQTPVHIRITNLIILFSGLLLIRLLQTINRDNYSQSSSVNIVPGMVSTRILILVKPIDLLTILLIN